MQKYKKKTTNDALKRKNEEIIVSKWDKVAEKRRNKLKEQQNQWLLIFVDSCANCDVIAMIIELIVIGLDKLFYWRVFLDGKEAHVRIYWSCFGDYQKRIWGLTEPLLWIKLVAEGSSSTWRAFGVAMAKVRHVNAEGSEFQ